MSFDVRTKDLAVSELGRGRHPYLTSFPDAKRHDGC